MKKLLLVIGCALMFILVSPSYSKAQLLKGFGKKLEKKIEQRVERKADRQVDKVLDKADKKTEIPIEKVLNKPQEKSAAKNKVVIPEKSDLEFANVVSRPDQPLLLLNSNCNEFSWFQKGSELEYEVFDEKGRLEAETKMIVKHLRNEGSATIAEVAASLTTVAFGQLNYQMKYICDGDKIYMDIAALMQAMMENNPGLKDKSKDVKKILENTEFNFDNGFASFPKKMYPGMKLEDLSFSFKTNTGNSEMSLITRVNNRQVIAKEIVKTKAGTFECLKIRSITNTSMKVMGVSQQMPQSIDYLWIASRVGVVKQETHVGGKTSSTMQLKTIKM